MPGAPAFEFSGGPRLRFLKGGAPSKTVLIFWVAHLSRRATGGAFDSYSLIEEFMSLSG
jgi:hypothetical protein